jgi:SAM-dependent methyltransferase
MGRFETAVDFYRYREAYPAEFFATVAARLAVTKQTSLLDVGCGPGNLVLGFAPYAGRCAAVDREPAMLRAARVAAGAANYEIEFIEAGIEELACDTDSFDVVTMGRAIHWFPPAETLSTLERIVSPCGHIAVCGVGANDAVVNAWVEPFRQARRAWASEPDEGRYKVDLDAWFAPSKFRQVDEIKVAQRCTVSVEELVGRALSFSITCPAVLGERQAAFEAAIMAAVMPFAKDGVVEEEVVAKATVFGRR